MKYICIPTRHLLTATAAGATPLLNVLLDSRAAGLLLKKSHKAVRRSCRCRRLRVPGLWLASSPRKRRVRMRRPGCHRSSSSSSRCSTNGSIICSVKETHGNKGRRRLCCCLPAWCSCCHPGCSLVNHHRTAVFGFAKGRKPFVLGCWSTWWSTAVGS